MQKRSFQKRFCIFTLNISKVRVTPSGVKQLALTQLTA